MKRIVELKAGEEGIISDIEGGERLLKRLESLGVYKGGKVRLISSQFMKGPVTIMVGRTKAALGYGMAKKIKVLVQ